MQDTLVMVAVVAFPSVSRCRAEQRNSEQRNSVHRNSVQRNSVHNLYWQMNYPCPTLALRAVTTGCVWCVLGEFVGLSVLGLLMFTGWSQAAFSNGDGGWGFVRGLGFKIQDYFIISSEKLKRGWTSTTSQYTITHIVYFKTQRTVIENTSYIINKLVIYVI